MCECASGFTGVAPAYGLSAYAITHGGTDYPHDPGDLCRCFHVSPQPPIHMLGRSTEWRALVENWLPLKRLLAEEHEGGQAPRTYAFMRQLLGRHVGEELFQPKPRSTTGKVQCIICRASGYPIEKGWTTPHRLGHAPCPACGKLLAVLRNGNPRRHGRCPA